MSANDALSKIAVVAEGGNPNRALHWQRRGFQFFVLLSLVVIPVSGLFRIDPIQGAFMVLDRQIWFSDFFIVFGFWGAFACLLAMVYSLLGTAFCGWACPQNTLSEWANLATHKLLGKRADVSLDGSPMRVATAKNRLVNWTLLGLFCTAVAAALALIPLLYFYSPSAVWSFVTFQHDARLAPSLYWIYTVFFLVVLVDVTMIRHFMCRFMCIYKVWQHTFKTRQTLHVAYDQTRADECAKCNYCVTSCFLGIDPRKTDVYDSCINCGECITACNVLQSRKGGGAGLLKFALGERDGDGFKRFRTSVGGLFGRVAWSFPLLLMGLVMFAYGLWSYQPHHVAAYRADTLQGEAILEYRVSVANKFYRPAAVNVWVEGLAPEHYRLERAVVNFDTAERINVQLMIDADLPAGLYPFLVHAESSDGRWRGSFRVHHLATGVS